MDYNMYSWWVERVEIIGLLRPKKFHESAQKKFKLNQQTQNSSGGSK